MAILSFQKPDKVVMLEADDFRGIFEFRPLEPGYGITIGNALRRVLLSSLEGFAITSVRIEGVDHEFSSLPGVVEDMTDIILKLKQIRFRRQIEEEGLDKILEAAGFEIRQPGCSACLAMNPDKVPAGKYCVSTSNRNFEGRQGPGSRTLLASPLSAAAAAVTGFITDPRVLL